jgi:hypothetical protein
MQQCFSLHCTALPTIDNSHCAARAMCVHPHATRSVHMCRSYDRCHFISCGDPTCGHLTDHQVVVYKSSTSTPLSNRSWTLVATHKGGQNGWPTGTYYRPHVNYNPTTKLYVMIVNFSPHDNVAKDQKWRNMAVCYALKIPPSSRLTPRISMAVCASACFTSPLRVCGSCADTARVLLLI